MTNEQLIKKMKEDMNMRNFSKYTYDSYLGKTRDIIVLLILAGVTIATLTGNNGILTKTIEAKEKTGIASEQEAIGLAYNGAMIEKNGEKVKYSDLNKQFEKNGVKANASGEEPIRIVFDSGNVYTIDSDGNIQEIQNQDEEWQVVKSTEEYAGYIQIKINSTYFKERVPTLNEYKEECIIEKQKEMYEEMGMNFDYNNLDEYCLTIKGDDNYYIAGCYDTIEESIYTRNLDVTRGEYIYSTNPEEYADELLKQLRLYRRRYSANRIRI